MEMDPQKQNTNGGRAGAYWPHRETWTMAEGRQQHKNGNAKPTLTDNTQNIVRQNNEDKVQNIW